MTDLPPRHLQEEAAKHAAKMKRLRAAEKGNENPVDKSLGKPKSGTRTINTGNFTSSGLELDTSEKKFKHGVSGSYDELQKQGNYGSHREAVFVGKTPKLGAGNAAPVFRPPTGERQLTPEQMLPEAEIVDEEEGLPEAEIIDDNIQKAA